MSQPQLDPLFQAIDNWREAYQATIDGHPEAAKGEAQAYGEMTEAYEALGDVDGRTNKAIAERIIGRRLGWAAYALSDPVAWAVAQLDEVAKASAAYEALTPQERAWLAEPMERDLAEELFFSDRRAGAYR